MAKIKVSEDFVKEFIDVDLSFISSEDEPISTDKTKIKMAGKGHTAPTLDQTADQSASPWWANYFIGGGVYAGSIGESRDILNEEQTFDPVIRNEVLIAQVQELKNLANELTSNEEELEGLADEIAQYIKNQS